MRCIQCLNPDVSRSYRGQERVDWRIADALIPEEEKVKEEEAGIDTATA